MTIQNENDLIKALGNNSTRFVIDKASIANSVSGQPTSLWRATGQPGQGAVPTAAAVCTGALTGAIGFPNQTSPLTSYLGWLNLVASGSQVTVEIHDRIAHMGGLVGNVTTAQTVNLDLLSLAPSADRIGDSNYSDIQWWLEWYTDTGATASNATISVTYNDGSTGTLSVVAVGGTLRASRMIPLNNLIPAAASGKFIRAINSIQLSASTGAAGNFGFTATRVRTVAPTWGANKGEVFDWAMLGLPEIMNDSCLMLVHIGLVTSTGTVRGSGKIVHG